MANSFSPSSYSVISRSRHVQNKTVTFLSSPVVVGIFLSIHSRGFNFLLTLHMYFCSLMLHVAHPVSQFDAESMKKYRKKYLKHGTTRKGILHHHSKYQPTGLETKSTEYLGFSDFSPNPTYSDFCVDLCKLNKYSYRKIHIKKGKCLPARKIACDDVI